MKHTELPWHVSLGNNNYVWAKDCIIAKCNPEQAEMYREKSIKEDEANAAFIVKAVNNHYQLIETLQNIIAEGENHSATSDTMSDAIMEMRRAAAEAIKQAEES